jgi:glycosyltransferase involved in cell wall biosynthesis
MTTEQLSVSIVTCSFQQGRFLESTIRSVLDQNYPNLEYLIIDGGSTDESVDIIRRYAHRLSYWVSEADQGQTHALIKGFKRSRGDVMGWLCSDDLLLPGALATVCDFFVAHPEVDVVYGDALWIDRDGRFIRCKREMPFSRFVMLHDHNYIAQPSTFWRRSIYEAVGGLDSRFQLAMDTDLWERFSKQTKIVHIPKYLSCMRFYPEQRTWSQRSKSLSEDAAIRLRASFKHPLPDSVLRGAARIARITRKLLSGGYTARPPQEHLEWIREYARP